MRKKLEDERLHQLAAQEGLSEYFASLNAAAPTLSDVLDSLPVGPAIHIDDTPETIEGLTAEQIREATVAALGQGTKTTHADIELRDAPDGPVGMLMEVLRDIVVNHYCPEDPDPEAEFPRINPIIDIGGPDWGPYEITLYPFAHNKMKANGELRMEDIDADLHDALTKFSGDLYELAFKNVKIKEAGPAFKIICDTPVRLLQLLKALAAEHKYPSFDTVHYGASCQPDNEDFFEEPDEWFAYDRERQRNMFNNSSGFFWSKGPDFLDALPARTFGSREEAAATSWYFNQTYVLPVSFVQLENLLMTAMRQKGAPDANPLLDYH